jgi:hypothetical protein
MNDSDPVITRPFIHIKPRKGWQLIDFSELKEYRDLLYFLVLRDIKVKYKQTVLGGLWAVIQPFCSMVLFSLFFGTLAKMPSDGVPYPVFSYSALVAWTYFAHSLSGSGTSLNEHGSLSLQVFSTSNKWNGISQISCNREDCQTIQFESENECWILFVLSRTLWKHNRLIKKIGL